MRPDRAMGRTLELIEDARAIRLRMGVTVEKVREEINSKYLHPDDKIAYSTCVVYFCIGKIPNLECESAFAIWEWCEAHR